MKLFDIVYDDSGFDLSLFEKYNYKGKTDKGYIIIKFDVSEIEDVLSIYRKSFKLIDSRPDLLDFQYFFASDGFIYRNEDKCLIRTNKIGFFMFFRTLMFIKSRILKVNKAKKMITESKKIFVDSDLIYKRSVSSYKPFKYYNEDNNIVFNARLNRSKSFNQPLVLFMAGGGCLGYDNFKPLYEYYTHIHRQLKKYDCSVLIPQSPCSSNFVTPTISDYISSVRELAERVADDVKADKRRIYIIGTSYGGWCSWNMIYNSPDFFACGIPVMGSLLGGVDITDVDFDRFRSTSLWVAHSSDDDNVPIKSDDYCVEQLKEIGIDVKYTRWDKYGHKMCNKFYKSEPWAEWMFDQNKQ